MDDSLYPNRPLAFTKMHGLGNDFMVIDATKSPLSLSQKQIQQLADRHFGVGFDQLLVVSASPDPGIDFAYRIFNADGGEVEQCGNGARCFAHFVRTKHLTEKNEIQVATLAGVIVLHILDDGQVCVNMGAPRFTPDEIPFIASQEQLLYTIEESGQTLEFSVVNLGNPHAVLRVADIARCDIEFLGPFLESHSRFPNRVNVGFMQVMNRNEIKLRVFERGTGETLACGTGACAAVVAGQRNGWLDQQVKVHLPGGQLQITWAGQGQPVMMTGPAQCCYEGHWYGFNIDKASA